MPPPTPPRPLTVSLLAWPLPARAYRNSLVSSWSTTLTDGRPMPWDATTTRPPAVRHSAYRSVRVRSSGASPAVASANASASAHARDADPHSTAWVTRPNRATASSVPGGGGRPPPADRATRRPRWKSTSTSAVSPPVGAPAGWGGSPAAGGEGGRALTGGGEPWTMAGSNTRGRGGGGKVAALSGGDFRGWAGGGRPAGWTQESPTEGETGRWCWSKGRVVRVALDQGGGGGSGWRLSQCAAGG